MPEHRVEIAEPPSGMMVFGRHQDHHTAGYVFTRDDREGHGDPESWPDHWWCHDTKEWISWLRVLFMAETLGLVLSPLFREPSPAGCGPDGVCDETCTGVGGKVPGP